MKKRYTIITVIIVLIISISAVVDLNMRLDNYFSEMTALEVGSDTITNVTHTNMFFETKYEMLQYIAKIDVVRKTPEAELNFGNNVPGFLRLYIYRADGNGYCNGKFLGNFAEHEFFEKGMNGQKSLYVESYSGEDEFIFSVPVIDEHGNKKAVLSGVCSSSMIYDHMMINNATNQRVFIYDALGRTVMRDPTVNLATSKRMQKANAGADKVLSDMRNGQNGIHEFDFEKASYKMAYNKLDANDWYLVTIETEHNIAKKVHTGFNVQMIIKLTLIIGIIFMYMIKTRRKYKESLARVQEETSLLTKTIPGSTMMCKLDELLTIRYASEVMYSKLGYVSGKDNAMNTLGLREIIHPDDLKGFNKLYEEYLNTSSKFEYECRFICKNGKPRWMSCYARFVNNINGIKNLYLVAIDISEQKEAEKRLLISEQRYKAVVEQSNSVVFEYNIRTHDYFITNNFYELFNLSGNSADIFAVFMKQHRMHSDDKIKFEQMISDVYSKCGFREEELRIIDASGKYAWYSMRITSISESGATPSRIIGNLSNIDALKKSTLELENQAQSDLLTGCYNRETSLGLIRKVIENDTDDVLSALIIVDIDYFRRINDNYGHEVGDELLRQTGRMLKNQTRSSDIVGRIGDDEFIVFMRGCTAVSQVIAKIESFIEEAHNMTTGGYNKNTFSIGVAMYPTNTRDYDELYDMADKAAYFSKTTGCDKYTIYDSKSM